MKNFLEVATSQIGVKEIRGESHNETIVNYAKEAGFEWVNDDETPWCSIFINWCALQANLKGTNKATARSWLAVGISTENPEPGDIVVFWRGKINSWQGHVGIFMGYDQTGERIYTLGGNQGNQVSISAYPISNLLGFRRLSPTASFKLPKPVLKKGDTGEQVKSLQDSLKILGFKPGTSDGLYGIKTKAAVIQFQSTGKIHLDGIFNRKTSNYLIEVISS